MALRRSIGNNRDENQENAISPPQSGEENEGSNLGNTEDTQDDPLGIFKPLINKYATPGTVEYSSTFGIADRSAEKYDEDLCLQVSAKPKAFIAPDGPDAESVNTPDTFDRQQLESILTTFSSKYEISIQQSLVVIAKFAQNGGTNASKPTLIVNMYGKKIDINTLRSITKLIDKRGTVRKLVKSLRNVINEISVQNGWPGPLYKDLQRTMQGEPISSAEAPYCSEWNSDNYNRSMPPRIREALKVREYRIRNDNKNQNPNVSKPNKGKGKRKGK